MNIFDLIRGKTGTKDTHARVRDVVTKKPADAGFVVDGGWFTPLPAP